MENGVQKWRFKGNESITTASGITVRGVHNMLMENLNPDDEKQVLALGHGDPSHFPSFRTSPLAVDAVVDALRSFRFNCYGSTIGILPARKWCFMKGCCPSMKRHDELYKYGGPGHAFGGFDGHEQEIIPAP